MNVIVYLSILIGVYNLFGVYTVNLNCRYGTNASIYICNNINSTTFPYILPSGIHRVEFHLMQPLSLHDAFASRNWSFVRELYIYQSLQTYLDRYDFRGLSELRILHWTYGKLQNISCVDFSHTTYLKELDLTSNEDLSFDTLIDALKISAPRTLNVLILKGINRHVNKDQIILSQSFYQVLEHTELEILDISETRIVIVEEGINKYLHSLKSINISGSTFFGMADAATDIFKIETLEYLYLNSMFREFPVRQGQSPTKNASVTNLVRYGNVVHILCSSHVKYLEANNWNTFKYSGMVDDVWVRNEFNKSLPFEKIWLGNNNLRYIDASIRGLDKLEFIGLADNDLEYIAPKFFRTLHALKQIDLGNNLLWKMSTVDEFDYLFRDNVHLECINMTNNKLFYLPKTIFENNIKLKHIILGGNSFYTLDLSLGKIQTLETLDLVNNSILSISDGLMKDLELINQNNNLSQMVNNAELRQLIVDFSDNKFTCSCKYYQFINWVLTTNITLKNRDKYTCVYDDELVYITYDIAGAILGQCEYNRLRNIIINVSISVTALALLIALLLVIYKCKLRLKKKQKNTIRRLHTEMMSKNNTDKRFLAFVVYSHKDKDFVLRTFYPQLQRQLLEALEIKDPLDIVCINDKDFRPGEDIDEEVVRCIEGSDVIINLISKASVDSRWSKFETVVAHDLKKPLFLIFLEHVQVDRLPAIVRWYFTKKVRMVWPAEGEEHATELFWKLLCKEIIRHSKEHSLVIENKSTDC